MSQTSIDVPKHTLRLPWLPLPLPQTAETHGLHATSDMEQQLAL